MRLLSSILLIAGSIGLTGATTCNADNCARAVTGTANGLPAQSSRRNDCSSFFRVTVTPKTSTSTVTQTVTSATTTQRATVTNLVTSTSTETDTITTTTTINNAAVKRQVTIVPSNVPAYASACSGTVRYSSACSCFGVTTTTITVATPVTTSTVIVSATPTVSVTVTTSITIPAQATTFVTTTATAITCGGVVRGGGNCGCSYTQQCNTQFISSDGNVFTSQEASLSACGAICDGNFNCASYTYQKSTGTCTQIRGRWTQVPNTDYVSAPITPGTCTGVCTQAYRRSLEGMVEAREAEANPAPIGGKKFIGTVGDE